MRTRRRASELLAVALIVLVTAFASGRAAAASRDGATPTPQPTPIAESDTERIVGPLRLIGRVQAKTSFCSALLHGGAPAAASALGYEVALVQTIGDLHRTSFSNELTKAHSMNVLEADLRTLAHFAQSGRTELHGLQTIADQSDADRRREVLGYRDALDGAKERQYLLAKQIASIVGELEERPVLSTISLPDDPDSLTDIEAPSGQLGGTLQRLPDQHRGDPPFFTSNIFDLARPQLDPMYDRAFAMDDHVRGDLQTAADHASQALSLGNC